MKLVFGVICLILGVIIGAYLGIIWGFVGGIIQLIQSITPIVIPVGIAFGLARIFILSSLFGWGGFIIFSSIGCVLLDKHLDK